jgi:hypothetical protein
MRYVLGIPHATRSHPQDGFTVRTSQNALRMVVFFGRPEPPDGQIAYGGTGFAVVHKEDGYGFGYLVTARHVAEQIVPRGDVVVRVNTTEGKSADIEIDEIKWAYHPDHTVDVAVTGLSLAGPEFDISYYNLEDMVVPRSSEFRVQCGDPICLVGLFHWHVGTTKNKPVVHSGTIAMLPDDVEKIPIKNSTTGKRQDVVAYLVEAQTFEGLSGAPVFQREMVSIQNVIGASHNGGPPIVATGVQLLGVYIGAWSGPPTDELAKAHKWRPDIKIPAGIGIVVPAERILEIIMNDPDLKKTREEILQKRRDERAATTDSGISVPVATDENPKHREDFNSLVGAAAQKPKSAGQT